MIDKTVLAMLMISIVFTSASATVTLFDDASAWQAAVDNNFATIDFTDGENFTYVKDDYWRDYGVHFSPNVHYWHADIFLNDDRGVRAVGGAWLTFDSPQDWIAFDFPGLIWLELYLDGDKTYSSPFLGAGQLGNFAGLVSSQPFDVVHIFKPEPITNIINIDDLHFGAALPGPGALGLLALSGLAFSRRRRR